MKVTTDTGTSYEVLWMEGPTMTDGSVWLKMKSEAPMHELVRVFETAQRIEREAAENKEAKVFENMKLNQVQRERDGTLFFQFATEG